MNDTLGVRELVRIFPRLRDSLKQDLPLVGKKLTKAVYLSYMDIIDPGFGEAINSELGFLIVPALLDEDRTRKRGQRFMRLSRPQQKNLVGK